MSKIVNTDINLKFQLFPTLLAGLLALPLTSLAAVPNVFAPGNPIIASEVNENFDSIDQRVTSFEPDFSGFSTPFAADGATKNVVVLKRDNGGGNTSYSVRSAYQNSTEQISIDGVLTVRPFIFNYAFVSTDSGGAITSISNFIEAPDTADYQRYNAEISDYDIGTLAKTVTDDTFYETNTCSGNVVHLCYAQTLLNIDDSLIGMYDFSSNRALSGPITINGLTFNEIRLRAYTGTRNEFRINAKGVGEIYRRSNSGAFFERKIIYYYSNGNTGGSLAGTPFDTGQPLDGLFF
ncbi:hypothetical protein N8198_02260 [Gammaproteobacteria bacterium]|nr:hypothetical protein [Gammaproteobacteria bacterium]